jgi:hypothetical protein
MVWKTLTTKTFSSNFTHEVKLTKSRSKNVVFVLKQKLKKAQIN